MSKPQKKATVNRHPQKALKISARARYALRILKDIADHADDEQSTTEAAIAKRQGMSEKFLSRIVLPLRDAGLVSVTQGSRSGFALLKKLEKISLLDVIETVQGPVAILDCLDPTVDCGRKRSCFARRVWSRANAEIRRALAAITLGCLVVATAFGAPDPAPIVAVGLYKNGHAALTRRVTPEKGVARVEIPACLPSYGTFWHSAKTPVTVTTLREPRRVTVTFRADAQMGTLIAKAEKIPDMSLTVIDPVSRGPEKGPSDAFYTLAGEWLQDSDKADDENRFAQNRFTQNDYRIRLASGSVVRVRRSQVVASTGLDDLATGADRSAAFWQFEGSEEPFGLRYLTTGATWAPSYLLTFGKDGRADLFMNAEIRNEIADWHDVDVSLISGFPSIKYADVGALVGDADFASFERAVNSAEGGDDPYAWRRMGAKRKNGMMSQAMYLGAADGASVDAYQAANGGAGAGSDIHYRPIGKLSLKKDATVSLPLGAKATDYKRIVDWTIADDRDYWGRLQRNGEDGEQELWDSVKFKNPFEFPMTTGAIEITEEGRIVGQAQCAWTNPGDETLVKITKALSVKGRCSEEGDGRGVLGKVSSLKPDERTHHDGHDYRRETITAKIRVQNFRKEPATLNVKKTFSGEMVESDLKPTKTRNLPARDGRVNVERELTWEFDLQPGEKKEIKVVYWLWVRL